jgi:hypothetical protein
MVCRERDITSTKNPEPTGSAAFFTGLIHRAAPRQLLQSQSYLLSDSFKDNDLKLWNIHEQQHVKYVVS